MSVGLRNRRFGFIWLVVVALSALMMMGLGAVPSPVAAQTGPQSAVEQAQRLETAELVFKTMIADLETRLAKLRAGVETLDQCLERMRDAAAPLDADIDPEDECYPANIESELTTAREALATVQALLPLAQAAALEELRAAQAAAAEEQRDLAILARCINTLVDLGGLTPDHELWGTFLAMCYDAESAGGTFTVRPAHSGPPA